MAHDLPVSVLLASGARMEGMVARCEVDGQRKIDPKATGQSNLIVTLADGESFLVEDVREISLGS